jgi:acyl-coenzyme A thioesterase PaaI-like protein
MAKSILEQYVEKNQFGHWLGMDFKELNPGQIAYYLTIESKHLATPLAAHGGVIAALVDATLGVSGLSFSGKWQNRTKRQEHFSNFLRSVQSKQKTHGGKGFGYV